MDNMVYIIKNTGSIEYVFDNKEERQAKLTELLEREKHYHCTHYYYDTEDIPAGEYVCKYICKRPEWLAEHWVKGEPNKHLGLNAEEHLNYMVALDCRKCPFGKCSKYLKADKERIAEQLVKDKAEYAELIEKIRVLTIDVNCNKCKNKMCERGLGSCPLARDAGKKGEPLEYTRDRLTEARKKAIFLTRDMYCVGCYKCHEDCPHYKDAGMEEAK